ncbi:hypothetical protein [Brevibacterium sp. XM4083]|uniref:hypothetical protein n=1 Tax=Brevibacterium sp. XM4083 TaxID=2583238 RepID=UPI0033158624
MDKAADRLLLSSRQLTERVKRREIAAVKSGRKWVFRARHLEDYIDRMTQPSKWISSSYFDRAESNTEEQGTWMTRCPLSLTGAASSAPARCNGEIATRPAKRAGGRSHRRTVLA